MRSSVKREPPYYFLLLKIPYQRCIHSRTQTLVIGKSTSHHILLNLCNKRSLLWMTRSHLLHIRQPISVIGRCHIIFTLSRRNSFGILITIFFTEQAQIHIAFCSFLKICLLRALVVCRQIFKNKRVKKLPKQHILTDILRQ